jgi:hypothetical protein
MPCRIGGASAPPAPQTSARQTGAQPSAPIAGVVRGTCVVVSIDTRRRPRR